MSGESSQVIAQQSFDQAVNLIQQKKFSEAAQIFEQLRKQGLSSFGLEANLGRANCELEHWGLCMKHFYNALYMNRFDFDLRENIQKAQLKMKQSYASSLDHPVEWGFQVATWIHPVEAWVVVLIGLLWILLFKYLGKLTRSWLFYMSLMCGFFVVAGVGAYWGTDVAIVISESDLHSAPLLGSSVQSHLSEGTRLRVIREEGDMAEVERPGSFRGWLEKAKLFRPLE